MMKRMNESRTLPQARATMLETLTLGSAFGNQSAGDRGRLKEHAVRRLCKLALGGDWPGSGQRDGTSSGKDKRVPRSPLVHEGEDHLEAIR